MKFYNKVNMLDNDVINAPNLVTSTDNYQKIKFVTNDEYNNLVATDEVNDDTYYMIEDFVDDTGSLYHESVFSVQYGDFSPLTLAVGDNVYTAAEDGLIGLTLECDKTCIVNAKGELDGDETILSSLGMSTANWSQSIWFPIKKDQVLSIEQSDPTATVNIVTASFVPFLKNPNNLLKKGDRVIGTLNGTSLNVTYYYRTIGNLFFTMWGTVTPVDDTVVDAAIIENFQIDDMPQLEHTLNAIVYNTISTINRNPSCQATLNPNGNLQIQGQFTANRGGSFNFFGLLRG